MRRRGPVGLRTYMESMMGHSDELHVDAAFPGGNVVVHGVEDGAAHLEPDLRDTEGWWFYWYFRVTGAGGRPVRYVFEGKSPIGARGPAYSVDGGASWRWLGMDGVENNAFTFTCPPDASEVRFCFGIPYLEANLGRFLSEWDGCPALRCESLCESRGGRRVELVRAGRLDGNHRVGLVLTARHHACEMMANYVLEGMLETVVTAGEDGRWFRENAAVFAVPFVDKDGVEQGDQGKNRRPRDHNRDYAGASLYPEVEAIRRHVPEWARTRPWMSLDLHCPWIRGGRNEEVFFPGINSTRHWDALERFSGILEEGQRSPLRFRRANNLPYGKEWNKADNFGTGKGCSSCCSGFDGNLLATTIEVPYANAGGAPVTPESARLLGHDLARSIRRFLAKEAG